MIPALIALSGPAGSGKTTIAKALVEHHGYVRVSFAQPIRDMLRALGLTEDQMATQKTVPIDWLGGKTPRQVMQSLGTEWGRDLVTQNLWVNAAENRVKQLWQQGKQVVIDDCRFDNEAVMVAALGGKVVRLEREGAEKMDHASERGISEHLITTVYRNNGDLESLGRNVAGLLF